MTVGKTFFVSFQTDYENGEFALLTTLSETKTAFFKKNGIWDSWDNHPFNDNVGSLLIKAVVRETTTDGMERLENDGHISVYPNPAKDKIQINCPYEIKDIKIFNAAGACLVPTPKTEFMTNNNSSVINIKNLANGVYNVKITTEKSQYHTKFIKE